MKKIVTFLLLFTSIIFLGGCTESTPLSFSIGVDEEATLNVGDVIKLSTNSKEVISWTSSDPKIATINENGIVEALSPGIVNITAKAGNSFDSITLIISNPNESNVFINGSHNVYVGEQISLNVEVDGENINSTLIEWTSSDLDIAEVNDGIVIGKAPGIVAIKAYLPSLDMYSEHIVYVKYKIDDIEIYKNIIESKIYELVGDFDLAKLSERLKTVIDKTKYAVVGVSNYQNNSLASVGSGVIYQKETKNDTIVYTLLTNYHVIEDYDIVKVYLGYHDLEVDGNVVKYNQSLDLAIIQFESKINFPQLSFADPSSVNIGDFAIAIGNPTGYDFFGTVTFGIISYPSRVMDNYQATYVQHDVAINPGNSGGPLIDMDGNIIGINTLKISSYKIDNLGFSIDVTTILSFIES